MATKIVILGDGLLGSEIHNQTGWDMISRKSGTLNINDFVGLYKKIFNYDVIINCIANTDSYSSNKEDHWDTNYRFASELSDMCSLKKRKLVQISTEFVYANNKGLPTEEDLPLPDNTWYAYTKLLADEYIKMCNKNYLICRLLHKPNPFPYPNVFKTQTSGDTVDKIAQLVIELIKKDANGVYNVGTGNKFLKEIAPNSEEIEGPHYIPRDTRMNLNKLNKFLNNE